jgi:hypothetical protein
VTEDVLLFYLVVTVRRNPTGKRGGLWVAMSPVVTLFLQGLSRSAAAASEMLGHGFDGVVVSDRSVGPI